MIHNITIGWPNVQLDADLKLKEVINDTIIFNITMADLDLSDYKIRCVITDDTQDIQLANVASGGTDDEIDEIDAESGMSAFKITVAAGLTNGFLKYSRVEVEIEDTDGNIFTILNQQIILIDEKINWSTPE
jgi:hypothetical protein